MNKGFSKFGASRMIMAIAAFGLALQLSGCTSSDEQNDVEAVQDVENLDAGAAPAEGGGDDALLSDSLPEDALGMTADGTDSTTSVLDEATAPTDTSMESTEPPSMVADEGTTLPPDLPAETTETASTESLNELSSTETETASADTTETISEPEPEPAPKKNIPLQKVASTPWKVDGRWVNAVYFARPGDSLSGISQTIYGEDQTEFLQKVNPTYQSREPRPGDKVYYASAKRTDDAAQVLTWYEENGMAPQIHVAKNGENIRSLSKDLLGFDGAWKEVWSSNPVESKGSLDEGTELRYWASAPAAPTQDPMASGSMENNAPPAMEPPALPDAPQMAEAPPADLPPAPDMAGDLPPPPPMPESSDFPPPPPMEPQQAMNDLPPPPPPMEEMPPPPPPVQNNPPQEEMAAESSPMDEDTVMALGTVAAAAAGIAALLVIRRRRKQKELENQFGDSTHVGT